VAVSASTWEIRRFADVFQTGTMALFESLFIRAVLWSLYSREAFPCLPASSRPI